MERSEALQALLRCRAGAATFGVPRIAVFLGMVGDSRDLRRPAYAQASAVSTDWVGGDLLYDHGSRYDRSVVRKTLMA
jgi:hypothetical protein